MISAKEARDIANQSDVRLNDRLERLERKIKEKSAQGMTMMDLTEEFPYDEIYKLRVGTVYCPPILTPVQKQLQILLEGYGYAFGVSWKANLDRDIAFLILTW